MCRSILIVCLFLLPIYSVFSDEPKAKAPADPVREKLEISKTKYLAEKAKAREKLLDAFDEQVNLASKGNLKVAELKKLNDTLDREKKAFDSESTLPMVKQMETPLKAYKDSLSKATAECEEAFKKARKAYSDLKKPDGKPDTETLKKLVDEQVELFKGPGAAVAEKWIELFNGKDTKGWSHAANQAKTNASIQAKSGALLLQGGGTKPAGHFVHDAKAHDDCKLILEGVASADEFDGVLLRTSQRDGKWTGYLISMGAETTGAIYKFEPGVGFPVIIEAKISAVKPGAAIKMEITIQGNQFIVEVDGKEVVNAKETSKFYDKGSIGLRCAFNSTLKVTRVAIPEVKK